MIITNSILRSYNTFPSDEIQQIGTGFPVTVPFNTYESKMIGSFTVDKQINGGFRLYALGSIDMISGGVSAPLVLWFSKKDYGRIDYNCTWCDIGPGIFAYERDLTENTQYDFDGSSVIIPKINIGDVIELWGYFRYIGSGTITLTEIGLKFTGATEPPLYPLISACKSQLYPEQISDITIHVVDDMDIPISDVSITLSVTSSGRPGTLNITSGATDINGDLKVIYTSPKTKIQQIDTISANVFKIDYSDGVGTTQINIQSLVTPPPARGDLGTVATAGLFLFLYLHKRCEDYDNKKDCEKIEECEWKLKDKKCIKKEKKIPLKTIQIPHE